MSEYTLGKSISRDLFSAANPRCFSTPASWSRVYWGTWHGLSGIYGEIMRGLEGGLR